MESEEDSQPNDHKEHVNDEKDDTSQLEKQSEDSKPVQDKKSLIKPEDK